MSFRSDEWSFAFQAAQADIEEHRDSTGVWRSGVVRTPHGFVAVYSGDREFTQYRFPFRGRMYTRVEGRDASSRALAIAAGKFARRIAGGAR